MVAAEDPVAVELVGRYKGILMPNMDLSEEDAKSVVEYLGQTRREDPEPGPRPRQASLLEP